MRFPCLLAVLLVGAPAVGAQSVPEWWGEPTTYGGLGGGVVALVVGIQAVEATGAEAPESTAFVLGAVPLGVAAGTALAGHLTGRDGTPIGALGGALVGLAPGALLAGGALLTQGDDLTVTLALLLGGALTALALGPVGAAVGYEGAWGRLRLVPVSGRPGAGLGLRVGL